MHRTASRRLDTHRGRIKSSRRARGTASLLQPLHAAAVAVSCPYQPGAVHGCPSSSSSSSSPSRGLVAPWTDCSSLQDTLGTAGLVWPIQASNNPIRESSSSGWGLEDSSWLALADDAPMDQPPIKPGPSTRPYNTPPQQQQRQQQQRQQQQPPPWDALEVPPAAAPHAGLHHAAAQAWQREASSSVRSSLESYSSSSSSCGGASSSSSWPGGGSVLPMTLLEPGRQTPSLLHPVSQLAAASLPAAAAARVYSSQHPCTYGAAEGQQRLALSVYNLHQTPTSIIYNEPPNPAAGAVTAAAGGAPVCVCCYPPALTAGRPQEVHMYLRAAPGAPAPSAAAALMQSSRREEPGAPSPSAAVAASAHFNSVWTVPYHLAMWQGGCLVTEVTGGCCSDATMIRFRVPPLPEGPLTLHLQLNSTTSTTSTSSTNTSSCMVLQQLLVLPEAAAADLTNHWAKLVQQATSSSNAASSSSSSSSAMGNAGMGVVSGSSGGAAGSVLWLTSAPPAATAAGGGRAFSPQHTPDGWQQWLEGAGQLQPATVQSTWHKQYMPLVNDIATLTTWACTATAITPTCSSSCSTQDNLLTSSSARQRRVNAGQQTVLTEPRQLKVLAAVVKALTAAGLWALLQHVTNCVYGVGAAAKALYSATTSEPAAAAAASASDAAMDAACGVEHSTPPDTREALEGKQPAAADEDSYSGSADAFKISPVCAGPGHSPPVDMMGIQASPRPNSCSNLSVRTPSEASIVTSIQPSGSQASMYPHSSSSSSSSSSSGHSGSSLVHSASGPLDHTARPCVPQAAVGSSSTTAATIYCKDMSAAVVRVLCLLGMLAAVAMLGSAS